MAIINYSDESANPRWDQHGNMPKHADHARATDKPVAKRFKTLRREACLKIPLFGGVEEFGRTLFLRIKMVRTIIQEVLQFLFLQEVGLSLAFHMDQRMRLEEWQWKIESVHDLHATILSALGLDHENLTYRYSGRDFRLTDVHGKVVHELFA